MNLSRMRDIDAADPIGTLGPRVTPAPTPAPAPVKRGDGFIVGPDGKLSTDLPDPTVTPTLCKCGLLPTACAQTECPVIAPVAVCAREPLKVGDRVRLLNCREAGLMLVVSEVNRLGPLCNPEHNGGRMAGLLYGQENYCWERVK